MTPLNFNWSNRADNSRTRTAIPKRTHPQVHWLETVIATALFCSMAFTLGLTL